jgi:hypothetical protein
MMCNCHSAEWHTCVKSIAWKQIPFEKPLKFDSLQPTLFVINKTKVHGFFAWG